MIVQFDVFSKCIYNNIITLLFEMGKYIIKI